MPTDLPLAQPARQPAGLGASAPLHILHVIGTLDPAAGGPTEFLRALQHYGPPGYTSEAVTLDEPDAPFLARLPFPVHGLGGRRSTYGFSRRLTGWLRANCTRFDGIVVNGLWLYCGLATRIALRGRTGYVVFPHGMLDPYFRRAFPRKHLKKLIYWLLAEYWVLRGAERVLFTTAEESRLARQSFRLHCWHAAIVPFGASRPPAEPHVLRDAFFARCPTMRDRRFLLFLGRIHPKKGCELLVRAFAELARTDPDLHLLMAGPDQEGWIAALSAEADAAGLSDRVHWPGMLEGEAKWGAFVAAECFVLPSHQENFGIAVAEALACACPVLLTDKVNIAPEIAGDGAALMETDTPAGIRKLLARWIATAPAERERMRFQALETFRDRYDLQTNAPEIVEQLRTRKHVLSTPKQDLKGAAR